MAARTILRNDALNCPLQRLFRSSRLHSAVALALLVLGTISRVDKCPTLTHGGHQEDECSTQPLESALILSVNRVCWPRWAVYSLEAATPEDLTSAREPEE